MLYSSCLSSHRSNEERLVDAVKQAGLGRIHRTRKGLPLLAVVDLVRRASQGGRGCTLSASSIPNPMNITATKIARSTTKKCNSKILSLPQLGHENTLLSGFGGQSRPKWSGGSSPQKLHFARTRRLFVPTADGPQGASGAPRLCCSRC